MRLLLHQNFYIRTMCKKAKTSLLIFFAIFCSLLFSCNANDLVIDDIYATYVYDETGSIMINVGFTSAVSEDDVLFLTITSPDGLLTWSDTCVSSTDKDKKYYTIGDIVLPYKISGTWTAEVARSDKSVKTTFVLNAPEGEFNMSESLESVSIYRVNGNVYTIRAPKIKNDETIFIYARNNVRKITEEIIPMIGETEKSIAINFKSSALVFALVGDDGVVYRKKIII